MNARTINRSINSLNPEIIHHQGVKRVLVKFSGGTRPPQETLIGPGTTSKELLRHLGLSAKDFNLSKGSADSTYGLDEPIYPDLVDGDLLFVTSRVDAGA
jgi:hypothetical protein